MPASEQTWREQVLAPTREVRRLLVAAEQSRYCIKILRVEASVEIVVTDASLITDDEVKAGKAPPEVLHGPAMHVLFDLTRGSNPFRLSSEERETLNEALRDAKNEVRLRLDTLAGKP